MDFITARENGIVLDLLIQPGSKSTSLESVHGNRLKIKVSAKAIEGAANSKLQIYMSTILKVSKSSVILLSGEKSRQKSILVSGDPTKLTARIKKLLDDLLDKHSY